MTIQGAPYANGNGQGMDKKWTTSLIWPLEQRFIAWVVPRLPQRIRTYHLTLCTLPINGLIILFCYLARIDIRWLSAVSICIFMQWLTDSLDGAVGRYQNEGLVRWAYLVDHGLDFTFLCSILVGYSVLAPESHQIILYSAMVSAGFMIHSFLEFSVTNKFSIAHFGVGPTESRLAFIIGNEIVAFTGRTTLVTGLPYVTAAGAIVLFIVFCRTQRKIWREEKKP